MIKKDVRRSTLLTGRAAEISTTIMQACDNTKTVVEEMTTHHAEEYAKIMEQDEITSLLLWAELHKTLGSDPTEFCQIDKTYQAEHGHLYLVFTDACPECGEVHGVDEEHGDGEVEMAELLADIKNGGGGIH